MKEREATQKPTSAPAEGRTSELGLPPHRWARWGPKRGRALNKVTGIRAARKSAPGLFTLWEPRPFPPPPDWPHPKQSLHPPTP